MKLKFFFIINYHQSPVKIFHAGARPSKPPQLQQESTGEIKPSICRLSGLKTVMLPPFALTNPS